MQLEIKKGNFLRAVDLAKNSKKALLYIFLLDMAFFAAVYIIGNILNSLSFLLLARLSPALIAVMIPVYYLALILLYSFFKFVVLHLVKSTFHRHSIDFKELWKFYLLNLAIILILLLAYIIMSFFVVGLNENSARIASLILILLYFAFAYLFLNFAQVFYYENKSFMESLLLGLKLLYRFKNYYGILLVVIFLLAMLLLIFLIFGTTLKNTLFQDPNAFFRYGGFYNILFAYAAGIIFYLAILYNRFYFYVIVRNSMK